MTYQINKDRLAMICITLYFGVLSIIDIAMVNQKKEK